MDAEVRRRRVGEPFGLACRSTTASRPSVGRSGRGCGPGRGGGRLRSDRRLGDREVTQHRGSPASTASTVWAERLDRRARRRADRLGGLARARSGLAALGRLRRIVANSRERDRSQRNEGELKRFMSGTPVRTDWDRQLPPTTRTGRNDAVTDSRTASTAIIRMHELISHGHPDGWRWPRSTRPWVRSRPTPSSWPDRSSRAAGERAPSSSCLPELAMTGYPPEDLLLKRHFVAAAEGALAELATHRSSPIVAAGRLPAGGERDPQQRSRGSRRRRDQVATYAQGAAAQLRRLRRAPLLRPRVPVAR